MTISETYPIHHCVYRNDQATLTEILKDKDIKKKINEKDNHGNTPLNLALMLGRRNCIITLINNGSDIISRNHFGWNPLEESIFLDDVDIIEKISIMKIKASLEAFSKITLKKWNKILPNLYIKEKIKIKSPITILAKILGSHIIEIYKKGNYFKLNTSIAGISLKGIPKVAKGDISIILRFNEKTGDCKCILLDNKNKIYQEIYPKLPQWCISDIIRNNINIKTLYKVFLDFSDCIIKHKKSNLIKKSKKTFQMQNGKSYKADLYKIKGIKAVIRKRDNEIVIGDYKSDIRTKILDLTSNPIKCNNQSNNLIKNNNVISDNQSEIELSDNDSISSDNDNISNYSDDIENNPSNEEINKNYKEYDSIFKKYINNDIIDEKTETILTEIIMNGEDSEHNKIRESDILFLTSNYPEYIKNLINKPISRKNYLKMLKNLKLEENKSNSSNINEKSPLTLNREIRIKANEDPSVAFYKILSGIPNEEYESQNKNEEKNRLKSFDWNKNKVTEEDYFDPSNTDYLHMGRLMSISDNTKTNKYINVWMSQNNEFPISLDHLEPLFEFFNMLVFDNINNTDNDNIDAIIGKQNIALSALYEEKRFPIKIDVPIYPTIKMSFRNLNCSIDPENIKDEIFNIPLNYEEGDILFGLFN